MDFTNTIREIALKAISAYADLDLDLNETLELQHQALLDIMDATNGWDVIAVPMSEWSN